jgi:hypothetical protein
MTILQKTGWGLLIKVSGNWVAENTIYAEIANTKDL